VQLIYEIMYIFPFLKNLAHIIIIGVYAPYEGRDERTRLFYKQLQKFDK